MHKYVYNRFRRTTIVLKSSEKGLEVRFYSSIFQYNLYHHNEGTGQGYFSDCGEKSVFHKKSPKGYDLKHSPKFRNILCVKTYPFLDLPTAAKYCKY